MDEELKKLIEENDLTITVNDVRKIYGKCNSWKTLLDDRGYNLRDVLKNGLKASELFAFDDEMAMVIIKKKYE